ncbi:ligand-binding sensor domain-containing protein/signal transduction histidine kinase/DNA-binding response OmpR family regulator [Parabacteroides sp. PFB2-12]|uniref:hybrid sensor histidine kinase/response regulator transcription factor n=1 Tax=unclassified Parabacteroides TaxID=2649774 RepID=UPI002476741A|nr:MULTISPECIES: hybrid sensor histidine kinase/response regulator transcription factor [unclassified Parabacteroides]MDH6341156.1 ligand-binding sensor domain-containing protein/signal transduction histidine kinase/DNA-binding response OmpR family regulator [Parabacteroides sp. PM6-13]MDH6389346.1 ligand-binding sensor domain-containing protein/signal transduction histidine kinase/DNA-binding response OmpR family regulator [Parabacteroides sp. PFB2-12]
MKQIITRFFFGLCLLAVLPSYAKDAVHYYFRTMDIRDGLSQNTVYQILQDKKGFMWFGTKDGLNRYDGLSFRVYKKENSDLGKNFITALYEDHAGNIWIGTDGGVFIYDPVLDSFEAFDLLSDKETVIRDFVTMIGGDEDKNIWISVENQGMFCYKHEEKKLLNHLSDSSIGNITRFWFTGNTCWLASYADNLYYTEDDFKTPLQPFRDAGGNEIFKGDVINWQVNGSHNCVYVASLHGLTEINQTTGKTRRLLNVYARALQFRSDDELWVGTESGVYIYNLANDKVTHLAVPDQDDSYALSDNAIYALYRDTENGMWIGSYFGGVNYHPYQWTYFEKFYPRDDLPGFGRRVREICESNDGTLWIGTEDKGLFNFNPKTGNIIPFGHPAIHQNVHGLCLDGDDLWVGTFSGGLCRVNLRTRQVRSYSKGETENSMIANDAFTICRTTTGDVWIGTTSGLLKYNRATDDFSRVSQLRNMFVYKILEDFHGNLWFATFSNGVFCYNVRTQQWKNYLSDEQDPTSLPYNKVISIYEDSKKRLWFMTLGEGFCRYNPTTDNFTHYDMSDGFPNNIIYKMVEDKQGNLWITTNYGLVCFNPETENKRVYTTANGLLSNQFNFQSGYRDKEGRIYLGSINGFIVFDPETFVENAFMPPVVITDFYLFNKRLSVNSPDSPLKKSITYSDEIELDANQNSFSLNVAALSYQAPEMNELEYKLEGFDREWYTVGKSSAINYSNLPYGSYKLRIKGSNSDGKWNEAERLLHIRINPPFYLSAWAYTVYVVLVLCLLVGLFFYFRKKTQRKQQQTMENFERTKERELYTAKIDFFTNVAHEIRTPLTLIKSPLENVLASRSVSDEIKDDLEIMDLNTNRLLDLVNQLLDFRKTETQGFQLDFTECDVADILHKTYKRFKHLARQKELKVTIEAPESLCVSVDKEGLTKILSNLLTNAIKYSKSYIHIKLSVEEERLLLSMCNDGLIIPADMREEIFKPFIQYKAGRLSSVSGTGIGLALARSLAELHEGTLCMDDSMEENCFLLSLPVGHATLPAAVAEQNEPAIEEPVEEEEAETASGANRYTILVVEDSLEMQAFVVKQLAMEYQVLTAMNGVEALKVLDKHTVDLVISDIMMPEMDGLELCERLKSELDYSHIPIILLTAKTTLQAKIEGMKIGADVYIEKPFSVEYLKVCVSSQLNNREKLRVSFAHSPFVPTNSIAMTKADESFLKKLNELVMENMQNPDFNLDDMAGSLHMSRSSLNRKIKGILDMTPNDYIRLERLKKAAFLLKEGECKINEVCYMTGFNTPSYFTKCFQKQFGVLPKDFVK